MAKVFSVFWALFGCLFVVGGLKNNGVERVFYWKEVIFEDLPYKDDTLIGPYPYNIPSSNDVTGVNHHVASGLMVTTVGRLRPGVPSTLNAFCLNDYDEGTSPHLWGFPNYERNTLKASFYSTSRNLAFSEKDKYSAEYYNEFYSGYNRENDYTIINIYYPVVSERCNRLFVVDTGTLVYSPTESYQAQNPALLVFELPLNGCQSRRFPLIRRVEIPQYLWTNSAGYTAVTLDFHPKGSCDDVFLYINSALEHTITVYDYKRNDFWVFADQSMKPIIAESALNFKTFSYTLPLGVTNIVLGYQDRNGDRNAYFGPYSSVSEYVVTTKLLKNKKASYKHNPEDFTLIGYRGCGSQAYKQAFDPETGVIFFGEINSHRISCWNTKLPFNPDTIGVVFQSDASFYPSEIHLDSTGYLWFLPNQLPILYMTADQLNVTEINSRLFRVKASEAIKGTICDNYVHQY